MWRLNFFWLSHASSASSTLGRRPPSTCHLNTSTPSDICKMSVLLQIASRVEAAVTAYISIKDLNGFTDHEKWEVEFKKEFVSVHLQRI